MDKSQDSEIKDIVLDNKEYDWEKDLDEYIITGNYISEDLVNI